MSHAVYRRFWRIVFLLCLASVGFAQSQPPRPTTTVTMVEELAAALIAAKTEEERAALLAAKKELQTSTLVQALLGQGNRLRRGGDFFPPEAAPRAIAGFQLAQRLAEQMGDKANTALALLSLGDVYRNQRAGNIALEHYQKSLSLFEELADLVAMANVMLRIGFTYSAQENFASALEYYKKSQAFYESSGNWLASATSQSYVGDAYRFQKSYGLALEAYQRALLIFEASGDVAGTVRLLDNLARVYSEQGKGNLAHEAKQRVQTLSEDLRLARQSSTANAGALLKLADRLMAMEPDEESRALLEAEKHLMTNDLVGLLLARCRQLRQQNNHAKAIFGYRLLAQIAEQVGNKIAAANAITIAGEIYLGQGNTRLAQEHYQKSLALWERMNIPIGAASALYSLGNVSTMQQNYGLALWYFQKARVIAEASNSVEMANMALRTLGIVYTQIGRYQEAEECLKQALAHAEAIGSNRGVAGTHRYFSTLYYQQGKFELARLHTQQDIEKFEAMDYKNYAPLGWSDLARLDLRKGNYAAAIENYQKSIAQLEALSDHVRLLTPLLGLAETYYQQGNYHQTLQLAERAAALAQPLGQTDCNCSPHSKISVIAGKAHRALNQPAKAQRAFDEAVASIEDLRTQLRGSEQEGQQFFEDKLSPYHEMVGLLVAQGQPAAALTYAERAKARTLLDLLRNDRADVIQALTAEEQSQEQRLKNDLFLANAELLRVQQSQPANPARLADLKARQQRAREAFETFQTGLYVAHPELKIKRGEAPALRPEEIAILMPDVRTALLEFVVTEERTFVFAITRNKVGQPSGGELKVYPLAITAKDLGARAEAFRQQLAKRSPDFGNAARELYDLLLKPAAAQLHGKTSLVIVPDGPLWELPFQALQPSANRFLIEDSAISYAPSLTALREMAKARKKPSGRQPALLALGNPALGQETISRAKYVLMDEKLDPLPEAEVQVKTLGRLYGPRQSKIYTGIEALEERAKAEAGKYRILHLATHGVLNDVSPMYSHLLLAQTGEPGKEAREDGLLEAWELMRLDLNADLVVLSACETARGRVGAGEGVIGLTWALFVAGCPRTVVSQWKVESKSTTDLMVEFHRQLKLRMQNPKSSLGAAQALRSASLKMLRSGQYRHPFWWAGSLWSAMVFSSVTSAASAPKTSRCAAACALRARID